MLLMVLATVIIMITKLNNRSVQISTYNYFPLIDSASLVDHTYFSLSYNEDREQADWVAYILSAQSLEPNSERTNRFRVDTNVITGTANRSDYYLSGYDRGHLVPAADMQFEKRAMDETFYFSNISPQLPGFNRGIWKSLEYSIRELTETYDSLMVFTGPVFTDISNWIGENHVSIPVSFYKVLILFKSNTINVSAYLIPHEEGLSGLPDFIVSIDSIESVTGIDFLTDLPRRLEKRLEKRSIGLH